MKTLGTLCALFCVFFLLETMAMEDSADSAASAGGIAAVLTAVCATAFLQWIQAVTGAVDQQLQNIVDEMSRQAIDSEEELRDIDEAEIWGDINILPKWKAKLINALRKKPRLKESDVSQLPMSTSTLQSTVLPGTRVLSSLLASESARFLRHHGHLRHGSTGGYGTQRSH